MEAAIRFRSNGSFRGETEVLYWFYSMICTVQLTESLGYLRPPAIFADRQTYIPHRSTVVILFEDTLAPSAPLLFLCL